MQSAQLTVYGVLHNSQRVQRVQSAQLTTMYSVVMQSAQLSHLQGAQQHEAMPTNNPRAKNAFFDGIMAKTLQQQTRQTLLKAYGPSYVCQVMAACWVSRNMCAICHFSHALTFARLHGTQTSRSLVVFTTAQCLRAMLW
jgi:hypothetical protein